MMLYVTRLNDAVRQRSLLWSEGYFCGCPWLHRSLFQKGNLLSYYSLSVQMARPIQGIPNKLYKYSSHHFDFGYRLSKKDIESCIAAVAAAKQTLEETTTGRTKTSTGDRFTQISTYLKSSYWKVSWQCYMLSRYSAKWAIYHVVVPHLTAVLSSPFLNLI